jgi:hypothetical protein
LFWPPSFANSIHFAWNTFPPSRVWPTQWCVGKCLTAGAPGGKTLDLQVCWFLRCK